MATEAHRHQQIKHTYTLELVESSSPTCWGALDGVDAADASCGWGVGGVGTVVLRIREEQTGGAFQKTDCIGNAGSVDRKEKNKHPPAMTACAHHLFNLLCPT